jgi:hypothetical protein
MEGIENITGDDASSHSKVGATNGNVYNMDTAGLNVE